MMGSPIEPVLAVIVPVYKHSVLLGEAVTSALNQEMNFDSSIVIVNDGCPMAETHQTCLDFVRGAPDRVHYIRRQNGGLSAARNTGVEYVLNTWETVRAFYFLDADNRILPGALQRAYEALEADPEVGWVYPNIDMFGQEWNGDFSGDYSVLRHLEENICEAGSLVRRAVFDKGARFDETMKLGFEDWDFWLTAVERGFRGKHLDGFGLRYRKRPESMVRDSDRDRPEITSYIRRKHKALFKFDSVLALEHHEAPRYGIFTGDTGCVALTSDPNLEGRQLGLEEFFDEYYRAKSAPMRYSRPAFVIVTQTALLDCLRQFRLLQWVFWYLETLVELDGIAHLTIRNDAGPHRIEVNTINGLTDAAPREPVRFVIVKTELLDKYLDSASADGITSLPVAHLVELSLSGDRDLPRLAQADALLHALFQRMLGFRSRLYQGSNWGWRENSFRIKGDLFKITRDTLDTGPVCPRLRQNGKRQIGFLLPLADFGGVEKTAYNLARVLKAHGWSTHLFVFSSQSCRPVDQIVDVFDSLNFLCDPEVGKWDPRQRFMGSHYPSWVASGQHRRALGLLAGLDVVVNCHCADAHALIAPLRRRGVTTVASLQVTDLSALDRPSGQTYLTLGYEYAYDHIACCSQQLFDWCHAIGIPERKLSLVLNGPSYPLPAGIAEDIVRERLARRPGPLRVMSLGRLDRQKGLDRLVATIIATRRAAAPIEWRVIGDTVIDGTVPAELGQLSVMIEPAKLTQDELTGCYEWADVLLILSRWEGLPLTIVEAMRLGVVVCATAVGAVAEAVSHGETGFLLPSAGTAAIVAAAGSILQALCGDRRALHRVSVAAAEAMKDWTWETTSHDFVSRLEQSAAA
jgi:glycosyltransferase involved in cell wall biosynthesis